MDKELEEELFSDDTEPQQNEIKEGLLKFKKLFAAVDATVISIITSPGAGNVTQDNLEQSSQTCKDGDERNNVTSVLDHTDSQKSLKEADPKKHEGEDDVDKPN
ncbi:uncharacterized protein LOC126780427 [Nymphalis io]|uniref:uncharacterized protein LOC126780427 n=1 Tax=Inachis io TaxID=171585 RepID=UPI0021694850|nr:uncharacterized protein LOC126780427 [Nymphalis io]